MPQFNVQMITNILSSALTATVASWLSYLAAWSHFSSTDNTALATVIAAGLAIVIGQILTIAINRYSVLVNRVAQNGTKVVLPDQKAADSLPDNPNVVGPSDVKVTKIAAVALAIGLGLMLSMFSFGGVAMAQIKKPAPQFTGDLIGDIKANTAAGVGVGIGGTLSPDQLLAGIGKVELVKLKYAQALAKASNNQVTLPCWSALVDVIGKAQQPVTDDKGQPLESPDPNLFAAMERASELLQALNTGGAIQIGCGAMLDASKKSVMQLVTAVVSGNGLAGFLPILPIP